VDDRVWLVHTDGARLRAFDGTGQQVVDTRLSPEPQLYGAALMSSAGGAAGGPVLRHS
jgi:hypothetical protein